MFSQRKKSVILTIRYVLSKSISKMPRDFVDDDDDDDDSTVIGYNNGYNNGYLWILMMVISSNG